MFSLPGYQYRSIHTLGLVTYPWYVVPYPTRNIGTFGTRPHTLPKIIVRLVCTVYKTYPGTGVVRVIPGYPEIVWYANDTLPDNLACLVPYPIPYSTHVLQVVRRIQLPGYEGTLPNIPLDM